MEALAVGFAMGTAQQNNSVADRLLNLMQTQMQQNILQLQATVSTLSAQQSSAAQQLGNLTGNLQSNINSIEASQSTAESERDNLATTVENMAACLANRTLLASNGQCQTAYQHCNPARLTVPDNGTMGGHALLPGSAFTFSCDPGTYLEGNSTVYCQHDGRWSSTAPLCRPCATGCRQCTGNRTSDCEDRLAGTASLPGSSCSQILQARRQDGHPVPSQVYTIRVNGNLLPVFCDMVSYGGGWALISKAYRGSGWSTHLNRRAVNVGCLRTRTFNCGGTYDTATRLALGPQRLQWFQCGNWQNWGQLRSNINSDQWWDSGCRNLCWSSNNRWSASASYNQGSAPDCGSPTCDGPSYRGRNWARRGHNGCGLGHGGYGNNGYWWVK